MPDSSEAQFVYSLLKDYHYLTVPALKALRAVSRGEVTLPETVVQAHRLNATGWFNHVAILFTAKLLTVDQFLLVASKPAARLWLDYVVTLDRTIAQATAPSDVERFTLTPPDAVEGRLEELLGFWRLYRDAYRLQAALFGTSTRQYVYRHKASIPGAIWRAASGRAMGDGGVPAPAPERGALVDVVAVRADMASAPVTETRRRGLAAAYPLLWDYAELIRAHGKHAVVVEIESSSSSVLRPDRADLNRVFHPHVSFVALSIPPAFRFDPLHLSAPGARAVAQALRRHAPP